MAGFPSASTLRRLGDWEIHGDDDQQRQDLACRHVLELHVRAVQAASPGLQLCCRVVGVPAIEMV